MMLDSKFGITIDKFQNTNAADDQATAQPWREEACRLARTSVQAFMAAAVVLLLGRPLIAQDVVHPEATQTTVVAETQSNATRANSPEPGGSTSDSATTASRSAASGGATGTISGTVLDESGALVPGAMVELHDVSSDDRREVTADESAAFKFDAVKPGVPYELSVHLTGFVTWSSQAIVLEPSQVLSLTDIHLKIEGDSSSVTVYASSSEIAVEQVHLEEQQRVLGFIPNFYVAYDGANAAPLTTKLKFHLAMKVMSDPITITGVGFMSAIDQAADRPGYVQGWQGYGQRFGANAAGGVSDILIGGAILPSLLHQDPRYFYQGTGGTTARLKHAVSSPFICRGDNGQRQINFSSIGGDMGATALSMTYFPDSDRSAGLVFTTFGINTAERMFSAIMQEFIIPRFTPSLKRSR